MSKASPHVLIAGAGIGGLTCALALAARGFSATVLERAETLTEVGAGLQISPNAARVLIALGLETPLRQVAIEPDALTVRSSRSGAELARMTLGAAALARYGAPYWVIHRADLQQALAEAAAAHPKVELVTGAALQGFESESQHIRATLENGEVFSGDALIGADGVRSTVRAATLADGPPLFSGYVAWRGTLEAAALPGDIDARATGLWLGARAHLVHYPLRGGKLVNVVALIAGPDLAPGWGEPADAGELTGFFERWSEPARALIDAVPAWLRWALADRLPATRWGEGPVTLLGDAAHPTLPFIAQGAAMAIEDAAVLAHELAASPEKPAAALRRYEGQRGPRTARLQTEARRNGRLYHLDGAARRVRNLALRAMPENAFAARSDWIYGWRPPES